MSGSDKRFFDFEETLNKCALAMRGVGVEEQDAFDTARSLVIAESRGLASHGLSRLGLYIGRIQTGKMEAETRLSVIREGPATLLLDANNGIGVPVGLRAMDMVSRKAMDTGVAFATVRSSNHFGMAGYIAERANAFGLIGYAASNGPARMPAFGASKPVFGTSPFACAVPTGNGTPILVDMATCVVARGKINMAALAGEKIPEGWALDEDGKPTTDPDRALAGSLIPFAGPKGSAIALLIEIFAGILGGNTWGRGVQDLYQKDSGPSGTSHSIAAIDIEAFTTRAEFEANLGHLVDQVKSDPVSPDSPVYLPGEREQLLQKDAATAGLTIAPGVVSEVNSLLNTFDIPELAPK